jgi:hypothetical protein
MDNYGGNEEKGQQTQPSVCLAIKKRICFCYLPFFISSETFLFLLIRFLIASQGCDFVSAAVEGTLKLLLSFKS